jgi:hypothetical protein
MFVPFGQGVYLKMQSFWTRCILEDAIKSPPLSGALESYSTGLAVTITLASLPRAFMIKIKSFIEFTPGKDNFHSQLKYKK